MSKQLKIALIFFIVALTTMVLWLLGGTEKKEEIRRPYVSDNWETKFQTNEKEPYGLYLFTTLLQAHIDTNKNIYSVKNWIELDTLTSKDEKVTMVFVGNQFGLQNHEIDTILSKVEKGSDLFLSYTILTNNINERIFKKQDLRYDYADSVNVFVGKSRFTQFYLYQNDTIAHSWKAFLEVEPIDSVYHSLSSFMEMPNFLRIKHGKGFIYVHTNPEFFFNYQLKRPDGYRYSAFVLNQFSKDRPVYLLELGRLLDNYGSQDTDEKEGVEGKKDDSYLQFLLKSPALMVAMGLTLIGLILFLLFRSKRLQPIVPYIPKKKNMSLEFTDTIASIYAAKQYPYGLLQVQRKNFLDTIHRHFFVDLSRKETDRERELQVLAQKSTVSIDEIKELLGLFETTEVSKVDNDYIIDIAKRQRAFYEKTGVIQAKVLQKVNESNFVIKHGLYFSYLLIIGGIGIILYGISYLTQAIGVGIVLWPLGSFLLGLGIIRISKPLLIVSNKTITHYRLFGKKIIYSMDDLVSISTLKNGAILKFTEDRSLLISYMEMSRFDKAQFKLFLSKNQQFEL